MKTFTSPKKVYSLKYPNTWTSEWDPDSDDTIMFWNEKDGMGTLRITPLIISGPDIENAAKNIITDKQKKVAGSIFNEKNGIYYLKWSERSPQEDGEHLIMHYWEVGKGGKILVVSFTTLEKEQKNPKTISDLKTAQEIVDSIKIL